MKFSRFYKQKTALIALGLFLFFLFVGIYAPLFANSYPLLIVYKSKLYFPFIAFLFSKAYYTKTIDFFFNALMLFLPLILSLLCLRSFKTRLLTLLFGSCFLCACLCFMTQDPFSYHGDQPLSDVMLSMSEKQKALVLSRHLQHKLYLKQLCGYLAPAEQKKVSEALYVEPQMQLWIEAQQNYVSYMLMPFCSKKHWEEGLFGSQEINQKIPWYLTTRLNRTDLYASLIFGIRISVATGTIAVALALCLGVILGLVSGYFDRLDLFLARFFEIWESIPPFFLLLFLISMCQTKSLFLIILILGLFGWTRFAQFVRAQVLKEKHLGYVLAAQNMGLSTYKVLSCEVLPNAVFSIITLIPFSMMAAISQEAGLSFLGLGEPHSPSWGVLMDEARHAFPLESYLLWPPAILLTVFLISIALIGEGVKNAWDPQFKIS